MTHTAFIGIGGNLGDVQTRMRKAFDLLAKTAGIELVRASSLYSSLPLLPPGKKARTPRYMNAACEIRTALNPDELLSALKEIEKKLGRKERSRWASREIDLDLLFFDDKVIQSETLTVPHPELHKRAFVLKPLAEIAPDFLHPVLGKTIGELERKFVDNLKVTKVSSYKSPLTPLFQRGEFLGETEE